MGGSPGDVKWRTCDVGELCSFSNLSVTPHTSQLIFQPFRRFTSVTAHSPILPLLHLHYSLFSNPSFASSTSQVLHLTSPGEPPILKMLIIFNSSCKHYLLTIKCFSKYAILSLWRLTLEQHPHTFRTQTSWVVIIPYTGWFTTFYRQYRSVFQMLFRTTFPNKFFSNLAYL